MATISTDAVRSLEDTLRGLKIIQAINEGNQVRLQELLNDNGKFDVNYVTRQGTPLHIAAHMNNVHLIDYLVKNEADVNARDIDGNTPLHRAVQASALNAMTCLLKLESVDLFAENNKGQLPSSMTNNRFLSERLLQCQNDRATRLSERMLQYARANNTAALQELFKNDKLMSIVNMNRQDADGNTLLHYAAFNNNASLIVWALQRDADVNIKNFGKHSPVDLIRDNDTLKKMLKEHATTTTTTSAPSSSVARATLNASTATAALKGTLQGYLYKWTNYRGMYRKRYFELLNGCLSYAVNEGEMKSAIRGVLRLQYAAITTDLRDRCQFVVRASTGDKYFLRADSEAEREKWIVALRAAKMQSEESSSHDPHDIHRLSRVSLTDAHPQISDSGRSSLSATANAAFPSHAHPYPSLPTSHPITSAATDPKSMAIDEQLMHDEGHQKLLVKVNALTLQSEALESLLTSIATDLTSHLGVHQNLDASLTVYTQFKESLLALLKDTTDTMEARERKLLRKLFKEMHSKEEIIESARELVTQHPDLLSEATARSSTEQRMEIEREEELARQRADVGDSDLESESFHTLDRAPRDWNQMTEEFFDAEDGKEEEGEEGEEGEEESVFYTPIKGSTTIAPTTVSPAGAPLVRRLSLGSYAGYPPVHRETLPSARQCGDISIWSIIRNCIGKDFSKVSMSLPVELNEPISMLQRLAEDLTYSTLLDLASERCRSSLERIQYVAAFAMTTYSATVGRKAKPFNPLLHETFELIMPERGFRYVAEQVTHRPPVSACYCESDHYAYYADTGIISKLSFTSMSINLSGRLHCVLKKHGEHYSWNKVTTYISNLTQPSNLKTYHEGEMVVMNHRTGEKCVLHFHPQGKRDEDSCHVTGIVYDADGKKRYLLRGRWNDKLISEPLDDDAQRLALSDHLKVPRMTAAESAAVSQGALPSLGDGKEESETPALPSNAGVKGGAVKKRLLWHVHAFPAHSGEYYGFSGVTFRLNEMSAELGRLLPPTDSRLRPDQRAMEEGRMADAMVLKNTLEMNQRARRKERTEKGLGEEPSSLWFERAIDEDTGLPYWRYTGKYWDARRQQRWIECPPIFQMT